MQYVGGSCADGKQMLAVEAMSSFLVGLAAQPVLLAAVPLPAQNSWQLQDLKALQILKKKPVKAYELPIVRFSEACDKVSHLQLPS